MSRSIIPPLVPSEKSKRTSLSAMPWTVQKEKEQYYTEHARYAVEIYSEMTVKECMCVCVCVSAQVLSCVQLFVTP